MLGQPLATRCSRQAAQLRHVLDELCTFNDVDRETVIFELEAIAVLIALLAFAFFLQGAIVLFTDNEGVHGAFVRCKSSSAYGQRVITCVCDAEDSMDCLVWYERVPSSSNPSDCLRCSIAQVFVLKCALQKSTKKSKLHASSRTGHMQLSEEMCESPLKTKQTERVQFIICYI